MQTFIEWIGGNPSPKGLADLITAVRENLRNVIGDGGRPGRDQSESFDHMDRLIHALGESPDLQRISPRGVSNLKSLWGEIKSLMTASASRLFNNPSLRPSVDPRIAPIFNQCYRILDQMAAGL